MKSPEQYKSSGEEAERPEESGEMSKTSENLEDQEKMLEAEIAESAEELNKTINDVRELSSNENMTPSLKEKLASSISVIGKKMLEKLNNFPLLSASITFAFGSHEFLIQSGLPPIKSGSILSACNEIALGAAACCLMVRIATGGTRWDKGYETRANE
jgi:archaellum component FlaD/FlaE